MKLAIALTALTIASCGHMDSCDTSVRGEFLGQENAFSEPALTVGPTKFYLLEGATLWEDTSNTVAKMQEGFKTKHLLFWHLPVFVYPHDYDLRWNELKVAGVYQHCDPELDHASIRIKKYDMHSRINESALPHEFGHRAEFLEGAQLEEGSHGPTWQRYNDEMYELSGATGRDRETHNLHHEQSH